MDKQISHYIVESCKKLGINYNSINSNYTIYLSDAQELNQLYRDLKEIAAKIQIISDRHQINGLNKILQDDIELIEKVDHDLVKIAQKIKNEDKIS